MTTRLIIALDFPAAEPALQLVKQLSPQDCKLKVGFELFVAAGPDFVRQLVAQGFDVFLDLKFHDIPNTVAAACKSAANLGVWMINVHAAGGDKMMLAAREALVGFQQPPKLIAVTVLTSMDKVQLEKINITQSPVEQVSHLAVLTKQCGLDGVVCSAQEAEILKQVCGSEFLLVTPGVRPVGSQQDDQSRVVTPLTARKLKIDYVVVGRPITQAKDPLAVIRTINQDLA
ncbi:orotidine-5'-phosphate decarboxylase [uncultured Thiothrix sp.]|uniref:orotidine-5'-phosphate decarboxylase n=1 Tax=uncultured Thiothrix sp. TaxID=223185 RepID=UPI002629513B|nr:orotidine-5'-phosphate decarboxylase [uncultured Thiothrix sp.]